jgi:hypothetical protein
MYIGLISHQAVQRSIEGASPNTTQNKERTSTLLPAPASAAAAAANALGRRQPPLTPVAGPMLLGGVCVMDDASALSWRADEEASSSFLLTRSQIDLKKVASPPAPTMPGCGAGWSYRVKWVFSVGLATFLLVCVHFGGRSTEPESHTILEDGDSEILLCAAASC